MPHGRRPDASVRDARERLAATRILGRFTLILALASWVACSTRPGRHDAPTQLLGRSGSGGSVAVSSSPSTAFVVTEPVAGIRQRVTNTLFAQVAFDERQFARIGPPVQGRVATVNVVVGDHVERGDVLLTIHSVDIAAAQAQLAEARTGRILAEQTAARTATLVLQGAASEAERLQADAAAQQARDEEHRAIATLSAIGGRSGTADYALRSPSSGTVVDRTVAVGNEVQVGQSNALLQVADLSTVWVIADVFESDLPLVHVGDEADVEALAYPGRQFTGHVTAVGNVVDPQTHALHARIELPNPDGVLRPGMFARVGVRGATDGIAEIPTRAILARSDQFFVFVRHDDGSFARREVRLGTQHGRFSTVIDGLRPGELIVSERATLLDPDANQAL